MQACHPLLSPTEDENNEDEHEDEDDDEDDEKECEEKDEEWEDEDEDKNEEQSEKFAIIKEYYTTAKPTLLFDKLLILFFHQLQDISGGACKESQAIIHVQNVKKVKEAFDHKSEDKDIKSLVKDGGSHIWRN